MDFDNASGPTTERPGTARATGHAPPTERPSVLVVDDQSSNLVSVEATLEGLDVRLATARSAEEALELAAEADFAVVLMNVRLPGMTGIEATATLRTRARSRTTPVILLTARETTDAEVRDAYAHGVVDFLTTPFLPEVVRGKVAVFVEIYLAREQAKQEALLLHRHEDQTLLQRVVDQSGEGIVVADAQGTLKIFNPAAERMHGATKKEVQAPDWAEVYGLFTLDDRPLPLVDTPLFRAVHGEVVENAVWKVKRPDGQVRILVGSASPLTHLDGSPAGGVLLTRDETERVSLEKERNEAVQRATAEAMRTRAITDNASLGLVMVDAKQLCTFMNPTAERIFGISFAEVQRLDKPLHDIIHHTRPDGTHYPIAECPIDRAVPERANQAGEDVFVRPDGSFYPVSLTASPLLENGIAVGTIIEVRDATDEVRAKRLAARHARDARLIGDIGTALTRSDDLHEILQQCSESIVRHLDAAFARIWTIDEGGTVLELQASAGLYTHRDGPHARVPVGQFKIGLIAQEGRPHLTNDVLHDERVGDKQWATREGMVSFAGYPLVLAGRTVGVMAMFARHPLDQDVIDALATVADSIALGIERSRAQQARSLSEMRYRLAIRATKDAIWDWNLITDELGWNEGVESLFGHTLIDIPQVITWWYEHVHVEDRDRVVHGIHEAIDAGRYDWQDEYRFVRADGSYALVTDRGYISRDAAGKPVRMVGSMQDVTEARRAEEALRESERQFRTLADTIPQLAWMAHGDGNIFWYNQQWYDFTGTTFAEMEGWGWKTVHDPSLLDTIVERWGVSLRTGEPFEIEFPVRRHDGVFRWHLTRATPVRDATGTIVRWFGTNTDIDDQRRIMDRQRFLSDASKVLASSLDYRATLRTVARLAVPALADWAAVDMLDDQAQLERIAVEHSDPAKVALAHELHERYPPDLEGEHGIGPVLRGGGSRWMSEIPDALLVAGAVDDEHLGITRSLGLKSYLTVPLKLRDRVLGAITLVYAESGRRYQDDDVVVMEDLAARAAVAVENARLFHEVRSLNLGLEQRVLERTAELKEANTELESFTYSVSHDLRAPLRHMTGFAKLLENRSANVLDEKSLGYVRTIAEAAGRGGQLVDDLLAFSRLGRAEVKKGTVQLSKLVAEVQVELHPDSEGRQVTWRVAALPAVQADASLVRNVLRNLLANALKYTRPKDEAVIEVSARDHTDHVEVEVRDNGVGFDMQYVDKLFGVFQRLHTAEQFEGTGIGLANVRRIIQRHGGSVWAEGTVGQGAAFHFTLPKASSHRGTSQ